MDFYAQHFEKAFQKLSSQPQGLSQHEQQNRIRKYGRNVLPAPKRRNVFVRFLSQFNHVLIYMLLVAATISLFLQHWIDAGVIFGVVIINALIGFIQEGKAEQALSTIKKLLSLKSVVLRDGVKHTVPAEELVVGDVVIINAGDKVPADLRLFETKNLTILESVLTGESLPVDKDNNIVPVDTPLAERSGMAYSGTLVTYGAGVGIVVATGIDTEIGKISEMLAHVEEVVTPLLKKMASFARTLTVVILAIAFATILFGTLLRDYGMREMFMAGISLAVAAIPEGLTAILTITLAVGVVRMAKQKAIIRNLPAIETMGSITTICSDKTGTLTKNELTVQHVMTHENSYEVSGSGYNDEGDIQLHGKRIVLNQHPSAEKLLLAGVLCNDAELHRHDSEWKLNGSPLEGALLSVALKAGLSIEKIRSQEKRLDFIPFDSEKKLMASLYETGETKHILVKGAPEKIVLLCKEEWRGDKAVPIDKDFWDAQCQALGLQGQRLIALAEKSDVKQDKIHMDDLHDLVLIGVVGMIDPPRKEVKNAVRECLHAGISVKMITGDYAATAKAVADQVGIKNHNRLIEGVKLDQLTDEQLAESIENMQIISRATPQHKLRLIAALQAKNHIVAMTGDGVNDAPALKGADIGIAMGIKGTEVTREAADLVLADDNFATIRDAVREGRTVYNNIKKAILYVLPNSFGEAIAIVMAILLGTILPITPLQILWINMVTTVTLDISLAFEPTEKNTMEVPPRSPDEPLLSGYLWWRVVFVALLMVIGAFGLFYYEISQGAQLATARSVVVNAFVAAEIVYLINCRKISSSSLNWDGLFGSRPALISIGIVIVLQLLFTYTAIMQHFFGVAALDVNQWLKIVGFATLLFLIVELEKFISRAVIPRSEAT